MQASLTKTAGAPAASTPVSGPASVADAPMSFIGGLPRFAAVAWADKRVEASLYRNALDAAPYAILVFDAEGRVAFVNPAFVSTYRLPSREAPLHARRDVLMALLRESAGAAEGAEVWLGETRPGEARFELTLSDGRRMQITERPLPCGGRLSIHCEASPRADALAYAALPLQTLIDLLPGNLWVKDIDHRFLLANDATARQVGIPSARALLGKRDHDIHPHERAEAYCADEREIMRSGRARVDYEEAVASPHGDVWLSTTKIPIADASGAVVGLLGISHDITQRKREAWLRDDQAAILEMIAVGAPLGAILERLADLVERQFAGMRAAVLLIEENGRKLRFGSGAKMYPLAYFQAAEASAVGARAESDANSARIVATSPEWETFRDLALKDGIEASWTTPVVSPSGEATGAIDVFCPEARLPGQAERRTLFAARRLAAIAIDRRRTEARVSFMATHDPLTRLPSRALLSERVAKATANADRNDSWAIAAFVDLDNFKYVNDSLGHGAGDEVLREAAERLSSRLSAHDAAIRLGGDEFVILLSNLPKDLAGVRAALEDLQERLAAPLTIAGRNLRITSSIGAARYPDDAADPKSWLACADAAMYHAKQNGRNNLQFYTPALDLKSSEKLRLRDELREAVRCEQFCLHYQPQFELATGAVLAFEALIRWRHPTRGLLSPAEFIPAAEDTGDIVAIGEWVIREACRQNRVWQDAGLPPVRISVNVSARQFHDDRLIGVVRSALKDAGLPPQRLELELTESLIMRDVGHAVAVMSELQRLGVQTAIDDFGSGYSSLAALKTFPVARLKIDKSFVVGVAHDRSDQSVTAAVIALGRGLNLRVIAEGVETAEQAEFLKGQNCDEAQGYLYGRPLPAIACESLIAGRSRP